MDNCNRVCDRVTLRPISEASFSVVETIVLGGERAEVRLPLHPLSGLCPSVSPTPGSNTISRPVRSACPAPYCRSWRLEAPPIDSGSSMHRAIEPVLSFSHVMSALRPDETDCSHTMTGVFQKRLTGLRFWCCVLCSFPCSLGPPTRTFLSLLLPLPLFCLFGGEGCMCFLRIPQLRRIFSRHRMQ